MALLQDKLAVLERVISFIMAVKTWKQLFIKLVLIVTIFIMFVTWYKWDDLFSVWKTSSSVIDVPTMEIEKAKSLNPYPSNS